MCHFHQHHLLNQYFDYLLVQKHHRLLLLLHARAPELLEAAFSGPLAGSLAEKYDFSNLESFGVYSRAALFYQFFDSTSEGAGIPEEVLRVIHGYLTP